MNYYVCLEHPRHYLLSFGIFQSIYFYVAISVFIGY